MRRRSFVTLLGGAVAWPLAVRAQQPAMPVIGYLHAGSPGPFVPLMAVFRQSLAEAGYVEGRDVAIEYRWAEGQYDRLPAMAAELVRRRWRWSSRAPSLPQSRLSRQPQRFRSCSTWEETRSSLDLSPASTGLAAMPLA